MIKTLFCASLVTLYSMNPHYNYIEKWSKRYKHDPRLILIICEVENAEFDRNKISHAGAVGIMQVKPIAFREYQRVHKKYEWLDAEKYPDKRIIKLLKSPKFNIFVGCWYLRHLLDKNNQNLAVALAKYNEGNNPENWRYVNKILRKAIEY